MTKQNQYLVYILERLQPHGPVRARAMFGGYGIYSGDVMFATIVDNELYFRIDDLNRHEYEACSMKQFIYQGMKKPISLPYFTLPEDILENASLLPQWVEKAYQAALRHKKPKKK